jgi:hypothetical protein
MVRGLTVRRKETPRSSTDRPGREHDDATGRWLDDAGVRVTESGRYHGAVLHDRGHHGSAVFHDNDAIPRPVPTAPPRTVVLTGLGAAGVAIGRFRRCEG